MELFSLVSSWRLGGHVGFLVFVVIVAMVVVGGRAAVCSVMETVALTDMYSVQSGQSGVVISMMSSLGTVVPLSIVTSVYGTVPLGGTVTSSK